MLEAPESLTSRLPASGPSPTATASPNPSMPPIRSEKRAPARKGAERAQRPPPGAPPARAPRGQERQGRVPAESVDLDPAARRDRLGPFLDQILTTTRGPAHREHSRYHQPHLSHDVAPFVCHRHC